MPVLHPSVSVVAFMAPMVFPITGHSSLLIPPSRNSIDRTLEPWKNGSHGDGQFGPDGFGCNCINATLTGQVTCDVGQSCFYFSNGCSIGCKECDGGTAAAGGANPNYRDRCDSGAKPTINAPDLRTMNRAAPAGSSQDVFRHNPWRAPGTAPVFDACGMAGGYIHQEAGEAKYTPTKFAAQGKRGSELPPAPSGTVWNRNTSVETAISIRANHGGGYSFRLCPASSALTEGCFQQTHLQFVPGLQKLRWANGSELLIGGTYVTMGTHPEGSSWAMNPLPYSNAASGPQFQPPCHERRGANPPPTPPPKQLNCSMQTSGPTAGFEMCKDSFCSTSKTYAFVGNVSLQECVDQCSAVNCECFDYNPKSSGEHPFEHCRVAATSAFERTVTSGDSYTAYRRPGAAPAPTPPHGGGQVTDGYCSGEFPYNVMVLDKLLIPADTEPGEYVLGFRWDCEKSAQVWSACADITIAA